MAFDFKIVDEVLQNSHLVGLVASTTLLYGAMVGKIIRKGYRHANKLNTDFQRLQDTYRDDFSKEELIVFYDDLMRNIKPYLFSFKKLDIVRDMRWDLEKQIMSYATQEVQEAIDKGATLFFNHSIEPYAPTYRKAQDILRKAKKEQEMRRS